MRATGVEVVVVGGGIAGVSAAAHLAGAGASVALLERESALSRHTTGRSAALYLVNYGLEQTRRLTRASRAFLDDPPDGFAAAALMAPLGMVFVGGEADLDAVHEIIAAGRRLGLTIELLDGAEVRGLCPVLRPEHAVAGAFEPGAANLDVAALHEGFVRMLRQGGGTVHRSAEVLSITRSGQGWTVATTTESWSCDHVVDAAGAWGDEIATRAGVTPVGLRPMRRTAATVGLPAGMDPSRWPAVNDACNEWYFKPEGDGLLISPADETPSPPCDAKADELDVALALERIARATTLPLRSIRQAWAGLRTFSPDGEMVIGRDPGYPGFVWCVGQGGYGIQSAPAVGRLTADLVLGVEPAWALAAGIDLAALSPGRLSLDR